MGLNLPTNYFETHSTISGDCWVWKGSTINSGYGKLHSKGVTVTAHKAAYLHYHGEIPAGMVVAHTCDNRLCVNPSHIECKAQAKNIQEMFERHRGPEHLKAGEAHASSKLSNGEVWQIKDLYKCGLFMNKEIAAWYGLKANTVVMIGNGTRRQNVPNPYARS